MQQDSLKYNELKIWCSSVTLWKIIFTFVSRVHAGNVLRYGSIHFMLLYFCDASSLVWMCDVNVGECRWYFGEFYIAFFHCFSSHVTDCFLLTEINTRQSERLKCFCWICVPVLGAVSFYTHTHSQAIVEIVLKNKPKFSHRFEKWTEFVFNSFISNYPTSKFMHNIPFKTFYIDFTLIRTLKQQNVIHWLNSMYNIKS
jgi:hypothetical protein